MDYNKIRALLEKYWEGESSLEEEQMLRHFFVTHTQALPEDLREAAPMFQYFRLEQEKEIPQPAARIVPLRKSKPWQHWMKYAAVLLIMAGVGYSVQQFRQKQHELIAADWTQQDTFDDPEKAYAETQKALQILSRNLNKGTEQMEKLSYFNDATQKIKN